MSTYPERVVVTGLGAVTPLGDDVASTWTALLAGRSGVRQLSESWAYELPVRIAAPAKTDPAATIPARQIRHMDRSGHLALIAAREAWQDAGAPQVEADLLGVSIGSGVGGLGTTLSANDTLRKEGWQRLSPFTVPMLMPNGAAAWVGIELGARAGVHTAVSACASSAEVIGYGMHMIRSGRADAGGAEAAILPVPIAAFAVMRALSLRNDDPERASRPFDKARDGFALGEGAGAVVLESEGHAAGRGAVVRAVAAGVGYAADAYHLAQAAQDGSGSAMAIQGALADADITPERVVHINAHAIAAEPHELRTGPEPAMALNNSFGFGGHNITLAFMAS
jgi:3-oxoacyl-[acyl-carrier-protein] synthase II